MVKVDLKICKRCAICIVFCPQKVFETDEMGLPIIKNGDACKQCLFCELHCPEYAIEVESQD